MRSVFRFVVVILLIFSVKAYGQTASIYGRIIENKQSVEGGNVFIIKNKKVVYYSKSDAKGFFKIPADIFITGDSIRIQALNFKVFVLDTKSMSYDKEYNIGTINLIPIPIVLDEVIIRRNRKYRDTTHIDLSKEHFERNIMIDNFLSGSNGFYKDAKGQLYFKGKIVTDIILNNGDFFGKNNLDIYSYLPALTLNDIEIVETNIDSITNTILTRPTIKVNLRLKDKFKAGKFGGAHFGYGTIDRYLTATNLYVYNKNEQISLLINSNNINLSDNPYAEPNVSFSVNGNNTINNSAKIGYRNLLLKGKIEIDFSAKGKFSGLKTKSESKRRDESINQTSDTRNSSVSRAFNLESTHFNFNYKIDTLNLLRARLTVDYNQVKQNDSLRYEINRNDLRTVSEVYRYRNLSKLGFSDDIAYQKQFSGKRGRTFTMTHSFDYGKYLNSDHNNIVRFKNETSGTNFIYGNRFLTQKKQELGLRFTEPLTDQSYFDFFLMYRQDNLDNDDNVKSDSIANYLQNPIAIKNQYIEPGIKFYKNFNKFSIDARSNGIVNFRKIGGQLMSGKTVLFNFNSAVKFDYKISKKSDFYGNYLRITNNPGISQLTNIYNSFDFITQMEANAELKPEVKNRFEIIYNYRKSDSLTLNLTGAAELFQSKFGFNINNENAISQTSYIDNIGSANLYEVIFSISKTLAGDKNISYQIGTNYSENPIMINNRKLSNKAVTLNQSFSIVFPIIKGFLTQSPTLSATYIRYSYDQVNSTMLNLSYTDKISFRASNLFELNLYPLINHAVNLNSSTSWAVNGEIKRSFFKNYGVVWLKAYDIFNSFKFTNNYLGSSYVESVKYTNLNRYMLLGLSLKFNNMK